MRFVLKIILTATSLFNTALLLLLLASVDDYVFIRYSLQASKVSATPLTLFLVLSLTVWFDFLKGHFLYVFLVTLFYVVNYDDDNGGYKG